MRHRIIPFSLGCPKLMSLFKNFSVMRDAAIQMSHVLPVQESEVTSDVSIVMMLGCFVVSAPSSITSHLHSMEYKYLIFLILRCCAHGTFIGMEWVIFQVNLS
jgi:hypothetical protein